MKTRDLIAALVEADPTGDIECSVGNTDIHFVDVEPAYYDGCLQVLRRKPDCEFYDIIGADYVGSGSKVVIHTLSISDMLLNDSEAPVGFIGVSEGSRKRYEAGLEQNRQVMRDMKRGHELQHFTKCLLKRLNADWNEDFDEDEIRCAAEEFYDSNMHRDDPLPKWVADATTKKLEDGRIQYASWNECREMQWKSEIQISFQDGKLTLTRERKENEG